MKIAGKFSLITCLSIILLLVGIVAFLNFSVPKAIKNELNRQVFQLTGYHLILDGGLGWSIFPLGVTAHKVALNNPPEFGPTPFIAAEEVRFSVKVLPLFYHQVEIKKILVKGLDIQLIKNVRGKGNWERFINVLNAPHTGHAFQSANHLPANHLPEKRLWTINVSGDLIYNAKNAEFSIPTFKVNYKNTHFEGNLIGNLNPLLSATGELQSEALSVGNLVFKHLRSAIDVQGSLIRLNAITANLYDGAYDGHVLINFHGETPTITLSGKVADANAGLLFKDFISNIPFTGTLNAATQLSFFAGSAERICESLNGNLHINVQNGVLHGVNIPALIELGQAVIKLQTIPTFSNLNQTEFGNLKATFQIKNGIMMNEDLTLQSKLLAATGHGKINLAQKKIDYAINANLVGQALMIPIYVRGDFDHPQVGLNTSHLPQSTKGFHKDIDQLKEKLLKKLGKFNVASLLG